MKTYDDLLPDTLTGAPLRRLVPKKDAPSPAEIVAASIAGLKSALVRAPGEAPTGGVSAEQLDQIIHARDEFWAEQIGKMTNALVEAMTHRDPQQAFRLVPSYENGDRITAIELVPAGANT